MTYFNFNDVQSVGRGVSPRVFYIVILMLLSYILLDFVLHHSGNTQCAELVFDAARAKSEKAESDDAQKQDPICNSVLGHLTSAPQNPKTDAWNQMKWIGLPARCKVKGQLIESLDEMNNFRRGFSLQFVQNVEDKTQVLPWLYGTKVDLNKRDRRVYLDLGANYFSTSVTWFLRMYPCDFTEVHAFEVTDIFRIPAVGFDEGANWREENPQSIRTKATPGIPDWMLKRIKLYNKYVSDKDDETQNSINITRFIKEELKLKATDTVVVKMDIEEAEWPILERWLHDPEMAEIIDELFVEIHYHHGSMLAYHWGKFSRTRTQATRLIAGLRSRGTRRPSWLPILQDALEGSRPAGTAERLRTDKYTFLDVKHFDVIYELTKRAKFEVDHLFIYCVGEQPAFRLLLRKTGSKDSAGSEGPSYICASDWHVGRPQRFKVIGFNHVGIPSTSGVGIAFLTLVTLMYSSFPLGPVLRFSPALFLFLLIIGPLWVLSVQACGEL